MPSQLKTVIKTSINLLISLCFLFCFPVLANESLNESFSVITPSRQEIAQAIALERQTYVQTLNYHPNTPEEYAAISKMKELSQKNLNKELIIYADELLKINPFNLDALNEKVGAYQRLGEAHEMQDVVNRWVGIFDSILLSGDGTSYETAYKIISFNEETRILELSNVELESRNLVSYNDKTYHFTKAINPITKKKFEVYFEITRLFQTFKNDEIKRTLNVPLSQEVRIKN